METNDLLVELEAIRESFYSHWRSMESQREVEVFKQVRKEIDTLIDTVRQRELNILKDK
jgi:hypothetical protein